MLFRDPSKPQLIIELPPQAKDGNHEKPKAVVVLLGWFGSKLRHVRKYAELYDQRGCATITGSLDDRSLMVGDLVKINELAMLVAKESAKLLRLGDTIPLIFHVFSNGGAIPLQRLELLMDDKIQKGIDDDVDDWKLIRDRFQLGAEIFDSAPAFPDRETFKGAMNAALPNPVIRFALFLMIAFYYEITSCINKLQGRQPIMEQYWSHWEESQPYAPIQAYIYSTADTITKSAKLDELVKTRAANKGVKVMVKRFDDTLHVQHMMAHKVEYCGLIDTILMNCDKGS